MIPIQEVHIYSDNDIKLSAHIVVPNENVSTAEMIIYNPSYNELYSAYQSIGQYSNPETAYKAIIEASAKYIKKSNGEIIRINNPCNTEFVDQGKQQSIVNNLSINVTVQVNGK